MIYKNLTLKEKKFIKYRHLCLSKIPSLEASDFIKNKNLIKSEPGIYIIWKKDNDKIYIGESNNVRRRLLEHIFTQYPKQYIDREIRKYGVEHFRLAFIRRIDNQKIRRNIEGEYVSLYNSYNNGYNGSKDGNPMNYFQRFFRKYYKKFIKNIFPDFYKRNRRYNYFKGYKKLKKEYLKLNKKNKKL